MVESRKEHRAGRVCMRKRVKKFKRGRKFGEKNENERNKEMREEEIKRQRKDIDEKGTQLGKE